jgi:hypothetical protein
MIHITSLITKLCFSCSNFSGEKKKKGKKRALRLRLRPAVRRRHVARLAEWGTGEEHASRCRTEHEPPTSGKGEEGGSLSSTAATLPGSPNHRWSARRRAAATPGTRRAFSDSDSLSSPRSCPLPWFTAPPSYCVRELLGAILMHWPPWTSALPEASSLPQRAGLRAPVWTSRPPGACRPA